MAHEQQLSAVPLEERSAIVQSWRFSWPLLAGVFTYFFSLYQGPALLLDGDTYWHITTGQWILQHGTVPTVDLFSHTVPGKAWVAHEWLSDVLLALAHDLGGWQLLACVTAFAFAATIALLARALLSWVEPIYALLFTGLGLAMTSNHLLARPHIIATPLLMLWTIELVRATEARRTPAYWMLPLMTIWANLHGGFTLGIALAGAFSLEAVLNAENAQRLPVLRSWILFVALATASSLLTPHGLDGILFTWHVLFNLDFVLERVGEWRSPNFHTFGAFELWLLGGIALLAHQGLRLPPLRLALVIGLLHLALKHVRYVELVGLLAPLVVAKPFGEQWLRSRKSGQQAASIDRFFSHLAMPASRGAILAAFLVVAGVSILNSRTRPIAPPELMAPNAALAAVEKSAVQGPVLNSYSTGGYLIYKGIPVFIDGRADMYGEDFMKQYVEAMELRAPGALEKLLDRYGITWTLLEPHSSATALLDHLPGWRRLHTDDNHVVHVRGSALASP